MQAAAVLAGYLGDWVDFGIILSLLMLNALVGFFQEFKAGSVVEELKKSIASDAHVVRDGTLKVIDASQVVPGDILKVEDVSG